MFEEDETKPRCPQCSQPLTFVRTRSHQKRWYCYSCEKFIELPAQTVMGKHGYAGVEALNGMQVIDSHGMIIGRIRKAVSNETGDIRSFLMSVDKEQFKNLLDEKDLPREFEVGHDRIATVGDVVILSDAFSPSALLPKPPEEASRARKCGRCGATALPDAKHCIQCGALLNLNHCTSCGAANPVEAVFCKNCGNRLG